MSVTIGMKMNVTEIGYQRGDSVPVMMVDRGAGEGVAEN
jgi:hypothetical protein